MHIDLENFTVVIENENIGNQCMVLETSTVIEMRSRNPKAF